MSPVRERLLDILELFSVEHPTIDTLVNIKRYASRRVAEQRLDVLSDIAASLGFEIKRIHTEDIATGSVWEIVANDRVALMLAVERKLERMAREARIAAREAGKTTRGLLATSERMPKGVTKKEVRRAQEKIDAAVRQRARLVEEGLCITPGCGHPAQDETLKCRRCRATDAATSAIRRERLIEVGLCTKCGVRQRADDSPMCAECSKEYGLYMRERRQKLASAGLCSRCGREPRKAGVTTCAACVEIRRLKDALPDRAARLKAIRDQRRASGLCTTCGEPAVEGKTLCQKHLLYYSARQTEYVERRRAAGRCASCSLPVVPGRTMCKKHLEASRKKTAEARPTRAAEMRRLRAERKAAGLCARCGKKTSRGRSLCDEHLRYSAEKQRGRKTGEAG